VIFVLCAMPGRFVPGAWWLDLLSADKLVHISVFFVLGFLVFLALRQRGAPARYFWFGLVVMYGVMLEIMQATMFSERSAEFADMLANTMGAGFAFVVSRRLETYFPFPGSRVNV
jgi:VanZ family protein